MAESDYCIQMRTKKKLTHFIEISRGILASQKSNYRNYRNLEVLAVYSTDTNLLTIYYTKRTN